MCVADFNDSYSRYEEAIDMVQDHLDPKYDSDDIVEIHAISKQDRHTNRKFDGHTYRNKIQNKYNMSDSDLKYKSHLIKDKDAKLNTHNTRIDDKLFVRGICWRRNRRRQVYNDHVDVMLNDTKLA